jgi:hypothetical protein
MQLIEFSLAGAEMELVDDLDFFRWLDAHGNEG